jgi:hypothetical protein
LFSLPQPAAAIASAASTADVTAIKRLRRGDFDRLE